MKSWILQQSRGLRAEMIAHVENEPRATTEEKALIIAKINALPETVKGIEVHANASLHGNEWVFSAHVKPLF